MSFRIEPDRDHLTQGRPNTGAKFPTIKLGPQPSELPEVGLEVVQEHLSAFPMVGKAGEDGASIDTDKLSLILGVIAYDADRDIPDTVRTALYLAGRTIHRLIRQHNENEQQAESIEKRCDAVEKRIEGLIARLVELKAKVGEIVGGEMSDNDLAGEGPVGLGNL